MTSLPDEGSSRTRKPSHRRASNSEVATPRWRRALTILGVAALAFSALGSWALSSAVGSAPDEDYHVTSAWCESFTGNTCEVNSEGNGVLVPEALVEGIACVAQRPQQSAGCQPLMDGTDPREIFYGQNNVIRNLYPSGYYAVMNVFVSQNIEQSVLSMRLFNAGLFVLVAVFVWLTLPSRLKTTYLWMFAITMVPLGSFIVASANPSGWAVIAVGSAWIVFLGFLESEGARSYLLAAMYLGLVVLGANARIDSLLYLALTSALAMGLSQTPAKRIISKIWVPALAGVFIVGWLIIVEGNFGTLFSGFGSRDDLYEDPLPWANLYGQTEGTGFDWSLLWANTWDIPGLWAGVFGGWPWGALGWLDTIMPQVVPISVLTVVLLVAYLAMREGSWPKRLTVVLVLLLMWAIPLYLLQLGGFRAGEQFQPRYLLPLIIVVIGFLLLTRDGQPLLKDKFGRLAAVLALSLANAIALHTNFRRYITGINYQNLNLNDPKEWWWFSLPNWVGPNLVWVVGSVAFATLIWIILYRLPTLTPVAERVIVTR